ncbi:hypothetical protein [Phnomibacter ginsenosidimutans]|uniref:Uncharacterized protein n=1 Tax=Phnomibacter ginsenosidimutans TaxID=2676868 RepID=A0A6I6G666_9BACT|nr:hypothetical protein [Phnomibacter ginsenosidimutans]QGW28156.1 hypothetical protein GLV81_08670 [Phnomibacter ginsenosidimutans]
MLFQWEMLLHQAVMVFLLISASVIAIVINQADLSGKKKLTLLRFISSFNLLVVIPAALFLLLVNLYGIAQIEYKTLENSLMRGLIALTGLLTLLIGLFRILKLSKEGLAEIKRKSIMASKYQVIFQKIRSAFMFIMLSVVICFWILFLNR